MRSKTWQKKIIRILHIYITLSRFTYASKQAFQHNHKPTLHNIYNVSKTTATLHKFLKLINEWLLVAKIIKRSSKLMSPNNATNSLVSVFKRLALYPASTLYYIYTILGDPGTVSWVIIVVWFHWKPPSSMTHSNADLRLGTKSNHWQAFAKSRGTGTQFA